MRRKLGQLVGSTVQALVLLVSALWLLGEGIVTLLAAIVPYRAIYWILRRVVGPPAEPRHPGPWRNAIGNQFTVEPPRAIASLTTLVAAVNDARLAGRRLRAAGSGHSFSDVAVHDEVMLDLHGMARAWVVDRGRHLVEVEGGMTIRALNDFLDGEGLALPNMGGYDAQTISGAISTATHGSGHDLGALCDLVRSVVLVTEEGRTLRIQPDGALVPSTAAADATLVKDDDLFHAVVVSMGCLGVVYSYVLEVEPAFRLGETRELLPWDVVVAKLRAGDLAPTRAEHRGVAVRHFELLVNPYPRRGRSRDCLVTYRWRESERPLQHHEKMRNPVATFVTGVRAFDKVLARIFTAVPGVAPFLQGAALRSLVDGCYVAKSYRVFNIGDANHVPAYSQELAFDATPPSSPGGGDPPYLRALEELLRLADAQRAFRRYHTVPISVRFVKASPHFLAMSAGRATAIFEIGMLAQAPSGWDLLRFYERRLCAAFGGRPHWGQANFILGPDRVFAMYPAFGKWLAAYARLCPRGTFDNAFSERLGLRTLAGRVAATKLGAVG